MCALDEGVGAVVQSTSSARVRGRAMWDCNYELAHHFAGRSTNTAPCVNAGAPLVLALVPRLDVLPSLEHVHAVLVCGTCAATTTTKATATPKHAAQ